MTQRTLIYLLFLAAGVAFGALALGNRAGLGPKVASAPSDPSQSAATPTADLVLMVEELSAALGREMEYRADLQEQILVLESRVETLTREGTAAGQAAVGRGEPSGTSQAELAERRKAALERSRARRPGSVTVNSLVDAGVDETVARELKGRIDELAMQRLYLRDQASREGWLGKDQYRQELQRINAAQTAIRGDYGEDVYDRYLYTAGRSNRVSISSVIDNSPAYNAGLRAGDYIVGYNEQRTYSPNEVRTGTRGGRVGEMVAVEFERDGQRQTVYIPRGPLGIQMTGASVRPPG